MSILSSRSATWIVPTWLVVIGLIGLLGAPLTSTTSTLLIIAGLVVPTIALSLSQKPSAMLGEVRPHAGHVARRRMPASVNRTQDVSNERIP